MTCQMRHRLRRTESGQEVTFTRRGEPRARGDLGASAAPTFFSSGKQ